MDFNLGATPRIMDPEPDTPTAEELLELCEPHLRKLLLYYCTTPQKRKVLNYWGKIEKEILNENTDIRSGRGRKPMMVKNMTTGEIFPDIKTAAASVGITPAAIRQQMACRSHYAGGCKWGYYDEKTGKCHAGQIR